VGIELISKVDASSLYVETLIAQNLIYG